MKDFILNNLAILCIDFQFAARLPRQQQIPLPVFEIYEQVNVALVVKPVCQDRPEDGQRLYFVLAAQGNYALMIPLNEFHTYKNNDFI